MELQRLWVRRCVNRDPARRYLVLRRCIASAGGVRYQAALGVKQRSAKANAIIAPTPPEAVFVKVLRENREVSKMASNFTLGCTATCIVALSLVVASPSTHSSPRAAGLLLVANQTASADFRYFEALTAAGIYYLAMTTAFMAFQVLIETALDPKKRRRMRRASLTERMLGITEPFAVR